MEKTVTGFFPCVRKCKDQNKNVNYNFYRAYCLFCHLFCHVRKEKWKKNAFITNYLGIMKPSESKYL